ncbi:MAG: hypothetical protein ACK4PC_03390 [Sphingopyxis sp.]
MKAAQDSALATGWQAERFARTKSLNPLADYLTKPMTPKQRQSQGAAKVMALFKTKAKKGAGDGAG